MNQSDGASPDVDLTLPILDAARAVEARIDSALGPLKLSLAKLNILDLLVRSDRPLTLGALAQELACVRSNVTQLVDRLEADGLVKREAAPEDRRSIRAIVTDSGRERQLAGTVALGKVRQDLAQILAGFDSGHIEYALTAIGQSMGRIDS